MQHRQGQRRWDAQPRARKDSRPQNAGPKDPIALATDLLNRTRTRPALLRAVEERVRAEPEERRRFAAAAGRVFGYTGEQALIQAVRNYFHDLSRPAEGDRTATLLWLAQTVAGISGAHRPGRANADLAAIDPRAAAEALFRPRGQENASAPAA